MRKEPRQRRADLVAAAIRLARAIGTEECVLMGGLAVGVHGYVRATDDLDFISRLPLDWTRERLRRAGIETRLLRGDVPAGFSCLKGEVDGIPFDVLPPLVPIAWEAALTLDLGHDKLRVVDLEGLLRLKLRAAGPQDPARRGAPGAPPPGHGSAGARARHRLPGSIASRAHRSQDPRAGAGAGGAGAAIGEEGRGGLDAGET